MVFMIGGATFVEAQEFAQFTVPSQGMEQMGTNFSQFSGPDPRLPPSWVVGQNLNLILGGTCIHNSKSFLKDVKAVEEGRFSNIGF